MEAEPAAEQAVAQPDAEQAVAQPDAEQAVARPDAWGDGLIGVSIGFNWLFEVDRPGHLSLSASEDLGKFYAANQNVDRLACIVYPDRYN